MGARKRRIRHDDDTRAKIQAAQLINRLYKCAMGEADMDTNQVRSATALLNKVLPDLQSVQADVNSTQHVVSADPLKPEDWAQQYTGDQDTTH